MLYCRKQHSMLHESSSQIFPVVSPTFLNIAAVKLQWILLFLSRKLQLLSCTSNNFQWTLHHKRWEREMFLRGRGWEQRGVVAISVTTPRGRRTCMNVHESVCVCVIVMEEGAVFNAGQAAERDTHSHSNESVAVQTKELSSTHPPPHLKHSHTLVTVMDSVAPPTCGCTHLSESSSRTSSESPALQHWTSEI